MNAKEIILNYWNWRSMTYTNGLDGHQDEERSIWKSEIRGVLNGNRGLNVLDVGTGPGFLALIFAEMDHQVTGVDISKCMLDKAKENARARDLEVSFCHGDAEALPFDDESFDLLVNRYLLWTLPDPQMAIDEWVRVLKPNGMILAIDGAWFDPALAMRLRRGLSKAITLLTDRRRPLFYSVFGQYYKPIRSTLPLYGDTKPHRVRALLEDRGLFNVSTVYLKEVQEFQNLHNSLPYRITHKDPLFLAMGEKY